MRPARALLLTVRTAALVLAATPAASSAPSAAAAGPYTALGDSYASGVGTRTYFADSGSCHRSPRAYPVLPAQRLGVPLTFAACSGARVNDVLGQLGSLTDATGLVSVSVGGNDAGFADVITRCALPWPFTCTTQINDANTFQDPRAASLFPVLDSTAKAMCPTDPRQFGATQERRARSHSER